MNEDYREKLGRVVRDAWIRWARTQPDPKPSWLVPYDDLVEPDKEADRQIGEAVFHFLNGRRIELIELKHRELDVLQEAVFHSLEEQNPRKPLPPRVRTEVDDR